ncbi:efflux RND transporter periplasmic adaptor subunit [Flavobacteriaceae bacterium AU392]|nr:efflux RND transporter periplasmic adaptor subunit [Flavobacteriaceae bacterium]RKM86631.1 efflux RND transporter periplasmic adaptor subunit [Flavobacteriaceae bacterium AU392]
MKHTLIILLTSFLFVSCGNKNENTIEAILASDDLSKIKEKRDEVVSQLQELDNKIKTLDTVKNNLLITTFIAKDTVFNHYLELQGSVQTKQNLVVYPETAGILKRVFVKEGQTVNKGQIIASIDDGGLGQQVSQLQIQADLAKTTFERQERLWNQKIGSEIQYLQAKSSYEAQQKAVDQLNAQLNKTNVRAPFSGVIDDVITEQGAVVVPGQSQLVRIVNLSNMYIETDVPESYISNITKNKDVQVEFPVLGTTMEAKIRQAGNFINPSNRTFKVEVAIPNKDKTIKPNLTAKLKINDYTNEKAVLIPQSIISEDANGQQYIYIIKDKTSNNDGITERRDIETGKTQGDNIEILSGIENGVEIVNEGARNVRNGQSVTVKNQ